MQTTIKRAGFVWSIHNRSEFDTIYDEIFNGDEYGDVSKDTDTPLVLDCGAYIGTSVLYFKSRCPQARIMAFEPDPLNYEYLAQNVHQNGLRDVALFNKAISDRDGVLPFYRASSAEGAFTCGNSLDHDWADDTADPPVMVEAVRLGRFLNQPIDLLKLDIEGLEGRVLRDCAPQLHQVRELYLEHHGMATNQDDNNLDDICDLLTDHDFDVRVVHKSLEGIFSNDQAEWVDRFQPSLAVVRASNRKRGM